MGETDTYEVETQFGPTEIETYECDSCGNRVAHENTVEFTIGDRTGRACEHCESSGPISPPRKVLDWALPKIDYRFGAFAILCGPLTAMFIPMFFFEDNDDEFSHGAMLGLLLGLVWLGIPLTYLLVS